jgi:aspartyl-tRNA(Asn)/glutamyl-tRNA(Gln) amidotransferase subunit B
VEYEVERQQRLIEDGDQVQQETRGWNEQKLQSYLMRVKEHENDYRYFPDPDLPPMQFTEEYIEGLRKTIPELPLAKSRRYKEQLGLSDYDANLLTADRDWAYFFEEAVAKGGDPKMICNWMNSDFAKLLNESGQTVHDTKITTDHLVELTGLIAKGTISGKIAKEIFEQAFADGKTPSEIVAEKGLTQISDKGEIEAVVRQVVESNPQLVQELVKAVIES